ncbi:alkene reductase [Modestobacter sp. Leaf380]|uniref:alkene reductase n=1 Tax=Modestobacter sp. Leaf380 TaxID=1736356 RepID=UPI0006F44EB0|nr:alkene reductase [Modestobacter sp. Leaf380]KQS72122.1 1,2-oxophytodienoate reductase [Modestobacter sp. Leaf380]
MSTHPTPDLFSPLQAGDLQLPNRVVMAPLTRMRSLVDGTPSDLNVEYYAQRASTGLIVTEGTFPSTGSRGYTGQAGLATDAHTAGWARVADAVHARGGRIVAQVMHAGRVSHPDVTGTDDLVAPSAIAITQGEVFTPSGPQPYPVPRALTTEEAVSVKAEFVAAARRAVDAGLDGVELHSANGYLLHEFLGADSNTRTDVYGGSPQARARFVIEVATEVSAAIGAARVGIRVSPGVGVQGVQEPDADDVLATYTALVEGLAPLGLAYLSVLHPEPGSDLVQHLRRTFGGTTVVNLATATGTTREQAVNVLADGLADGVVVGRPLIANPDLVERWAGDHPLNAPDPATFYASGAEGGAPGYTDYPTLQQAGV